MTRPSRVRPTTFAALAALAAVCAVAAADDLSPAERRQQAWQFHLRAQERTGLLVPLYVYPGDVRKNPAYKRLIDLKRRHETVPILVILNPASGPGDSADSNYVEAADLLCGAGCVLLGYVTTGYGKRPAAEVRADIDRWRALYPRVHGIFFDEMTYEDTDAAAAHQAALDRDATAAGFWPTVANPGADTPARYFAAPAADVIVVHEGNSWPSEDRLGEGPAGAYTKYPPATRAVLVHSQPNLDEPALRTTRKYARWVYVTDGPYRPNDPSAANPWDHLSKHTERLGEQLSRD